MNHKPSSLPREELQSAFDLYSSGLIKEAIVQIKLLNKKYPNQPLLFNLIGACFKELGELNFAAKMFSKAVTLSPKYAEAHFNLGVTFQDLGDKNEAVKSYRNAISILPNYPDAYNNLGNVLHELGNLPSAIESLEWAIAYKHDFAEAYNNLGSVYYDYLKVDKAIENFSKAINFNPEYEKAYFSLAMVFKDLGRKEEFFKNIEKALHLNPNWGHAYFHLSRVKNFKKNDPHIKKMKFALENKNLDSIDLIGLNFALAKAYEDIESHEEQFNYLNRANSLRKKELNYSIDKDKKLFKKIKESFKNLPSIIDTESNDSSKKPIFILGMPRSGTSLVHQILDSHKSVYGMGELNLINKFAVQLLKEFNEEKSSCFSESDILFLRESYFNSLPISGVKQPIVVDKMPLNFRYIGFILSAFPEAKIIHMERDPMASCWSIYKNEFTGNAYSFNQKDIAIYYKLYLDLMNYWKKLFPKKIFDFNYEKLTSDQERQTRSLLNYCELEWDENCLKFHKNKTTVRTTSSLQVRQKMYQGSSEAWKKYEAYLEPLIKCLNYN